jgi:phenylacetate-CoA ligase
MRARDRLVLISAKAKRLGGLDLAFRYNPAVRWSVRQALQACRSPEERVRRAAVERLTGAILERARQSAYGRRFGAALADWPVLSKAQVRARPADFVVPGLFRVPAATGGTTGVPLRLSRSLRCVAAEQVFLDELLAPYGLSWAGARVAVLRGDAVKQIDEHEPPFGKETHWGRRLVLSSPHLTAASLGWYLERLAAFQPDILYVWPTMMAHLLMLLAQAGRRLRVPLVVASSEQLDAGLYGAIERALGARVIDYYGLSERVAFAVRQGPEHWVFEPAYGRVELLATPEDEVAGGQRQVAIIATGFWNDAQPLVRYDTGDRALVPATAGPEELAAIARGEAPFLGIAGRQDDYVLTPDGRRISCLNMIAREVENVLQIQLVQDAPDHITLRALTGPEFGPADRARLMANARGKLPSATRVEIEIVDRLETTGQGKTPLVIRRANMPSGELETPLLVR